MRKHLPLFFVVALAFAVRVAAVLVLGNEAPSPDAVDDYLPIASHVVAGEGFVNGAGQPDIVRGPGYPLFLAAVQAAMRTPQPDLRAVRLAQAALDALTAGVVYALAVRLFGVAAGVWGGACYALHPLSVWACVLIGPETLFAFLLACATAGFVAGVEHRRRGPLVLAGAALGAAVLTRATPMLLFVPWAGWLIWRRLVRPRTEDGPGDAIISMAFQTPPAAPAGWGRECLRTVGDLAAFVAAAAVLVLPWTWRNHAVFGELIPVVSNGGVNFYAGSSERFWPAPPEHHRQRQLRMQELIDLGVVPPPDPQAGPGAGDKYAYRLGWENYRLAWEESPLRLADYLGRKSLRLWYATQSGRHERIVGAINAVGAGLALLGLLCAAFGRRLAPAMPLVLTPLYFVAVLTAMFPLARYVVGFQPLLCVWMGVAVSVGVNLLLRPAPSERIEHPAAEPMLLP